MSPARARTLVTDSRRAGSDLTAAPQVTVHSVWPVVLLVCGVLVALAGTLVAARSRRWGAMSARYENRAVAESSAREAAEQDPQKAAASLWTALDRGEDPTSG